MNTSTHLIVGSLIVMHNHDMAFDVMQPYEFSESCSHAWSLFETDGTFRFYVYYAVSKQVTWLE